MTEQQPPRKELLKGAGTDGFAPLEQYTKNLRELVKRLHATKAKLIWASTTPVPDGKVNPPRKNADVIAYNNVAKKIMEENGVLIDRCGQFDVRIELAYRVLPLSKVIKRQPIELS